MKPQDLPLLNELKKIKLNDLNDEIKGRLFSYCEQLDDRTYPESTKIVEGKYKTLYVLGKMIKRMKPKSERRKKGELLLSMAAKMTTEQKTKDEKEKTETRETKKEKRKGARTEFLKYKEEEREKKEREISETLDRIKKLEEKLENIIGKEDFEYSRSRIMRYAYHSWEKKRLPTYDAHRAYEELLKYEIKCHETQTKDWLTETKVWDRLIKSHEDIANYGRAFIELDKKFKRKELGKRFYDFVIKPLLEEWDFIHSPKDIDTYGSVIIQLLDECRKKEVRKEYLGGIEVVKELIHSPEDILEYGRVFINLAAKYKGKEDVYEPSFYGLNFLEDRFKSPKEIYRYAESLVGLTELGEKNHIQPIHLMFIIDNIKNSIKSPEDVTKYGSRLIEFIKSTYTGKQELKKGDYISTREVEDYFRIIGHLIRSPEDITRYGETLTTLRGMSGQDYFYLNDILNGLEKIKDMLIVPYDIIEFGEVFIDLREQCMETRIDFKSVLEELEKKKHTILLPKHIYDLDIYKNHILRKLEYIDVCKYIGLKVNYLFSAINDDEWDILIENSDIGVRLLKSRIIPKPYLIELLKNGKISIEELVKRRKRIEGYKFNPDSEADLIIEYSRLIFHLNKFSKKDIDDLYHVLDGLKVFKELIKSPEDITKFGEKLIDLSIKCKESKIDFNEVLERLKAFKELIKSPEDITKFGEKLIDLSIKCKESKIDFNEVLERLKAFELVKSLEDITRVGGILIEYTKICDYVGLDSKRFFSRVEKGDWDALINNPEIGKELISIRIFPKPYLIELLKNGKISIEELVKRRKRIEGYKFNPDSEADLIIEYSRLIFHLNKFSKKDIDKLIMPFEEFKKLSTKKHEEIPEIEKYEMDSLAYENLVVKNKIIKELLGQGRKLEVIGNTSLGLFYSLPLKPYFKGRKDVNFSISRVSSSDMHEREVFLKRELFDKSQLDNIIRKQMTTVVLDATRHKRMPDGLKGYRNYFAALNLMILRKMKNKKSNDADDIRLVAELTNQGVEVVEVILDELEKSGLDKVLNKWIFMIPTEKLRLYRIYDYDLDESGRYRIVREEVGDYTHTHGIENTLPKKESKEIPVVLVQCSVKGEKVPILLVKEGDMHKKGFFDDKDNFRRFALSFDDKGVHLNLEGVSKEISKRMANLESKTKQNR